MTNTVPQQHTLRYQINYKNKLGGLAAVRKWWRKRRRTFFHTWDWANSACSWSSTSTRLAWFQVNLNMFWKVIRSSELLSTNGATKRLDPCVFSLMASKLIWSWKPPLTSWPGASKRPFTSVSAKVSLEMRALGVCLLAGWIGAVVDLAVVKRRRCRLHFLDGRACHVFTISIQSSCNFTVLHEGAHSTNCVITGRPLSRLRFSLRSCRVATLWRFWLGRMFWGHLD